MGYPIKCVFGRIIVILKKNIIYSFLHFKICFNKGLTNREITSINQFTLSGLPANSFSSNLSDSWALYCVNNTIKTKDRKRWKMPKFGVKLVDSLTYYSPSQITVDTRFNGIYKNCHLGYSTNKTHFAIRSLIKRTYSLESLASLTTDAERTINNWHNPNISASLSSNSLNRIWCIDSLVGTASTYWKVNHTHRESCLLLLAGGD